MNCHFKLVVMGDDNNGKEQRPLSERIKVGINKNNFDSVLAAFSPSLKLAVENTLADGNVDTAVALSFQGLKDFEPDQVARQILQLRALLAMRNLLRDLKSNLLDNATFRHGLERILKDDALSDELIICPIVVVVSVPADFVVDTLLVPFDCANAN
ncbi:hypothetical protein PMM47T1_24228 [Pseudomonas sp. M47T1]|nr:hypothetical protein PMM47T1_24228 [Pseudomonas sp. M47T1]